MFDCDVRLDITLSTKQTVGGPQDFKAVVGIRISGDESGGVWRQLDKPDPRIPSDGNWFPVPTGVLLNIGRERTHNSEHFCFLRTMGIPPQIGARGPINVFTPGQRDYSSPNIKWAGGGDFEILARHANLPALSPGMWATMKKSIWGSYGSALGWHLTTTGGVTFSGGAGGYGGTFNPRMTLYLERSNPPFEERSFSFTSAGAGFMLPGATASISAHDLPSGGTELTKGTMPVSEPFRLEDLEGLCQIVEISGGGVIPIKGGIGAGPGASALGIIFGVPTAVVTVAYTACAWVYGVGGLVGKGGPSLGATLSLGYMTLNKKR